MKLSKILYAEDDPDIQEIARMALEVIGDYTVKTCSSGEPVPQLAVEFDPDLILLDVMMPRVDGLTALQNLQKDSELKKIPVIFMTAKVMDTEIQRYKELGAIDVIAKPFDPNTLCQQLQTIWESNH